MAADLGTLAAARQCHRPAQLGHPVCGCDHRPRPPACGGGYKGAAETEALGQRQGGFSTKVHLRADGSGKPLPMVVTAGQRHEAVVFEQLMEQGAVKRRERGRPRLRPRRVSGDKRYSRLHLRQYVRQRGMRMTIPRNVNERRTM